MQLFGEVCIGNEVQRTPSDTPVLDERKVPLILKISGGTIIPFNRIFQLVKILISFNMERASIMIALLPKNNTKP